MTIKKSLFLAALCLSPLLAYLLKSDTRNDGTIRFATSAEYPPFEYHENGVINGFDIDLGYAIAKELGKNAIFENMQFSSILPAIQSNMVDAAISTITITPSRQQSFDFSDPYYIENMAIVFKNNAKIKDASELKDKIISCQLGTTMEQWLKQNCLQTKIVAFDNNNQAIEAVKAGHVDGALIDKCQGSVFCKKNPGLSYVVIATADNGYGIALPKGSQLKDEINKALKKLQLNGTIQLLQDKWLGGA